MERCEWSRTARTMRWVTVYDSEIEHTGHRYTSMMLVGWMTYVRGVVLVVR